jgi:hypothetical protein
VRRKIESKKNLWRGVEKERKGRVVWYGKEDERG